MTDPWNDDVEAVSFEIANMTISVSLPKYYFASLEMGGSPDAAMAKMKSILEEELFWHLYYRKFPPTKETTK